MTDAAVTVLWRPGCPYCAMLLRGLERTGLAFARVDIWEDPEAAAWVRSVADGNETVPTVRIVGTGVGTGAGVGPLADASPGEREREEVALVNPSTAEVLEAVARVAPAALPDPALQRVPAGLRGRLGQLFRGRRGRDRGPAAPR
jgi:mycoredoxin